MIERDEQRVVQRLRERLPGLRAVYLFGSSASGESGRDSDVDLAVLLDKPLTGLRRFDLAGELADVVGKDVDLVDLRTASTVLRMQVIGKGRRLFGSGADLEAFEDRVFADYARLNEERAGILADVRARGSVYG
ncbi:MAG TPA: nucleotidyltransferase domain-containing protein [Gammaproteobacteria bacterium]|nr:nucleotidyltransferase domain-containing protein [Gammaproteobacteria bacterium]